MTPRAHADRLPDDADGRLGVYEELPSRYERQDWVFLATVFAVIVAAALAQRVHLALFIFGD